VGQKVHPYGFRLGFNKTWRSRWYADKDYAKLLHEDLALRQDLKKRFSHAGVSRIETERAANNLKIHIYTSRPGIIIGRKGTEVDKLKQEIQKRTNREVFINIQEIQKPELEAQLISSRWRCSSKSASPSAARCARPSSRRCASVPVASRCACRAA
jgi:small subunit ribosomal protein S3